MEMIRANVVDVIQNRIYPAKVYYDTHIREISESSRVVNSGYLLPGLVDAHVHIESSMLLPSEFARMAIQHGTLAAVSDPHEIANVLGIGGIDFMLNNASHIPFRFVFGVPSCVPATAFETAGSVITDKDIDKLFSEQKLSYLSEMMNFPGVINHDPEVMKKIAVAQHYGKPIDGHAPGLTGEALRKYIQAGISTDHECSTLDEADEKICLGMKILIREGSAAKNFEALWPLIERYPERVMLCTDDLHPDDLNCGHINQLLRKGIKKGLDLFLLLRAATVNPVEHYQIDLGLLQPGDPADFILVDDLRNFAVRKSFFRGITVFDRNGKEFLNLEKSIDLSVSKIRRHSSGSQFNVSRKSYPNRFGATKISVSDIEIKVTSDKMKVIQAFDGELFTHQLIHKVRKGVIVPANVETDILKLVVLNRYQPAKPSVAFIRGFGLKEGALASTVAHDSHHIIAVGCDDDSIVTAINYIIDIKGGLTAVYDKSQVYLKLDIAGLMSSASGEEVGFAYETLNKTAAQMGCTLTAPFMTLSFMALLVIPELKLSDKGLFDVKQFGWTDLFE